jgi:hypothetical protein
MNDAKLFPNICSEPINNKLQRSRYVYTISCKCGQEHIGEEGRPLGVRLKEYKHNLKDGLFGKSKLALYATEKEQKTVLYSKF